jgi:hypothetical protein
MGCLADDDDDALAEVPMNFFLGLSGLIVVVGTSMPSVGSIVDFYKADVIVT